MGCGRSNRVEARKPCLNSFPRDIPFKLAAPVAEFFNCMLVRNGQPPNSVKFKRWLGLTVPDYKASSERFVSGSELGLSSFNEVQAKRDAVIGGLLDMKNTETAAMSCRQYLHPEPSNHNEPISPMPPQVGDLSIEDSYKQAIETPAIIVSNKFFIEQDKHQICNQKKPGAKIP